MTQGRDNWKSKNTAKRQQIKSLSQKLERREKVSRHQYSGLVIYLCLVLRVYCKCSYRSVCKIIEQLVLCSFLQLNRIPSPTSIQNWVTKMGFYQRQSLEDELVGQERVLIVDESIRIGQEKQLLILSTPYEQVNRAGGLCSEDVNVHYFEGRTSWTGEQVSEELKKVVVSTGIVCKAVLSDEDSKLKKASRLQQLPHLRDICHATGTSLKKVFDKDENYQQLMKLLGDYRNKGVNQDLSYLLPPKQRSKARFLNLAGSVKWANKMLVNFKKLSPKELMFFEQLPKYKSIIGHLSDCIEAAKELTLDLKEQGISDRILKRSMEAIEQKQQSAQQQNKDFLAEFLKHLSAYFAQYQSFIEEHGGQNIPVSSEIIESLLGVYKNLVSSNQLAGATYLNFELDVRCMAQQTVDNKLKEALEGIFMTDLKQWKNNQNADNQLIKRRDWFRNRN